MVEGVEQVTLMFSNGDVVGIEQDVVNTDGAQTTVFIQDNDGMFLVRTGTRFHQYTGPRFYNRYCNM